MLNRHLKRMFSVLLAVALVCSGGGWTTPLLKAEDASGSDSVTVYEETFQYGVGHAQQSGGASLAHVTDKYFSGNDDGGALYVSNRVNNWDAADFSFAAIGLEHGKTYTVTASVYVDAGVVIVDPSEAVIQSVGDDAFGDYIATAALVAGEVAVLTGTFTADADTYNRLRFLTDENGKGIPFYVGHITITSNEDEPVKKQLLYHETFEDGLGIAKQSGGANISPADILFDGNDDGKAIYVSNRENNWDGVDVHFSDVGMVAGKTYTMTIIGYVDSDVTVSGDAQAYLQIPSGSYPLLSTADFIAGHSFTLTAEHMVEEDESAFRIQSSEDGATIPFYLGEILIFEHLSGDDPLFPPRPPSVPFTTIDFENGELNGFEARAGTEVLTVTTEENHTEDGNYALKVENRTVAWHGPSLRVEKHIDLGHEYHISLWVKLLSPDIAQIQLSTQIGAGDGASYNNLQRETISVEDGWVQLQGTYRYNSVGEEYVTIYVESIESGDAPLASFYIDDIRFEPTGSGTVDIDRSLKPIKEVYEDYFYIGNAVSSKEFEGIRLELLKLHHNLVTAENAMKPGYAYNEEREFDFDAEDALVQRALDEGFLIHGHVLVWHEQSQDWLHSDEEGNPLSKEAALQNLTTHVRTTVEHFGDRVISWDVVNEAMNDNPPNPADWRASLRQSGWYRAIGPDYIEHAFKVAKEVLKENGWEDVKLYYNDYNDDNQNKAEAIYQMVKEINEKYAAEHDGELLIDGIGMQGHYEVSTNPENVRRSLEKFISLGVEVGVTELDVRAGSDYTLTEKQANQQAYLYARLFQIYKEYAEHISRVTFWGLDDGASWRSAQNPLLFDRDLQAKPAYYAVIDPDKFIEEYDPEEIEAKRTTAAYGTPVIDGQIDEVWDQAETIPIDRYQTAHNGATGVARALWDENHLYVLVEVEDSELDKASENEYEQDSVEVFVDQNNGKTSYYQEDDGQYRVNYDNEASFNPPSIAEGFDSATVVSGTNYIVEMKIPLFAIDPTHETEIGFDVQINDARNGSRHSVAIWNDLTGKGYEDPSVFGVMTLIKEEETRRPSRRGGGGIITPRSGASIEISDGAATIQPAARTVDGKVIANLSEQDVERALEQATQITIDLTDHAGAPIEVQIPPQWLNGERNFVLIIRTDIATIEIPSDMLSTGNDGQESISIHIEQPDETQWSEALQQQIGDHPAIRIYLTDGDGIVPWNHSSSYVTVSIPYEPSDDEWLKPHLLVILYIDEEGNAVPIPNGRYDAENESVTFATKHFSTFAVAYVQVAIDDIEHLSWANDSIESIVARGVMSTAYGQRFEPSAAVSRADFVEQLVRVLQLQSDDESTIEMFIDVDANAWYAEAILTVKQLGIVHGFEDDTFRPAEPISRQDMMVLVARALAQNGFSTESGNASVLNRFTDANAIAPYARESIAALVREGIIVGRNGDLAPQQTLTRAEAAVLLNRLLAE